MMFFLASLNRVSREVPFSGETFNLTDRNPNLRTRSDPARFPLEAMAKIAPAHLAQSYGRGVFRAEAHSKSVEAYFQVKRISARVLIISENF
jgi:hypothetical protein